MISDEVKKKFLEFCSKRFDVKKDSQGQLVIYTGIYEWKDQSWRDGPDPELEDDPTDA
jgi:hypothetical protein